MQIHSATRADQAAIARVHCDSWHAAFSRFAPDLVAVRGDQYPRRYQAWGELLNDEQLLTLIAVNAQDDIIGFAQGGTVRPELSVPYDGELVRLYIAPQHAAQGVGKALIHRVANQLKADGHQQLVVVVWSINQPARGFYEHLGAVFVKEIKQEWNGFDTSQSVYVWRAIDDVIKVTRS